MNIVDLMTENLKTDDIYLTDDEILSEGLFDVSPIVAICAFKDKAFKSIENNGFVKAKNKIGEKVADVKVGVEKIKAKLGITSGKGDDATVYKFTKEQRKVLGEMYAKYGKQLAKQITDFRNDVIAPYQIIKRNVAKNRQITDREVKGMTREEYLKYRESARRKIERRATYNNDFENRRQKSIESRDAVRKARQIYDDFSSGKNVELSSSNIDKVLEQMGLGYSSLNNWSLDELDKPANEIHKLQVVLNNPSNSGELVDTKGNKLRNRSLRTRKEVEAEIELLKDKGYSNKYFETAKIDSDKKHGSFRKALENYLLRRDVSRRMRIGVDAQDYRRFYDKVLKDAIKDAEEANASSYDSFANSASGIELNQYEKKIWGLKTGSDPMSGNIEDWYLKIKDDNFRGVQSIKQPQAVLDAEAEKDAVVKRFEREISKTVSPEDLEKMKKYKLIGSPLTVRDLKDPNSLFKTSAEISSEKIERKDATMTEDEFVEKLRGYFETKFASFEDLNAAKNDIRDSRSHITKDIDDKYRASITLFLQRRSLKAMKMPGHEEEMDDSVSLNDIKDLEAQILGNEYYDDEQVERDRTRFNDMVNKYVESNPDVASSESNIIDGIKNEVEKKLNSFSKEEKMDSIYPFPKVVQNI